MKYNDIDKIEKIKLGRSNLLRIKLIKNKIYKKKHYINNLTIEELELKLKKALYIIYLFTIYNKRIVFVGGTLPIYIKLKKILKNTKHSVIPKSGWIPGIITNKRKSLSSLLLDFSNKNVKNEIDIFKLSRNLIEIKRQTKLIVILDENSNSTVLKEGYLTNIPIISLNNDIFNKPSDIYSSYKIPGNFYLNSYISKNNFFLLLLTSLIKKSLTNKKKLNFISNYKLNTIKSLKNKFKKRHKYFNKRYTQNKKFKKHFNKKNKKVWQKENLY